MCRLAEARNKFSGMFRRALSEGPQVVSRRGEKVGIVSGAEWRKATGKARMSPGQFPLNGPPRDGLDLARDGSAGREVGLE